MDAIRSNNAKLDGMNVTTLQQERAPSSMTSGEEGLDSAASSTTPTQLDTPITPHIRLAAVALTPSSTTGAVFSGCDDKFAGSTTPATIITTPAVLPDTYSPAARTHKVVEVLCDGSPDCIVMAPWTCSTECSNQVGAKSLPPPVMKAPLLPAATRALVADLVHPATNVVTAMQPFLDHDLDVLPRTRHQGLLLRPTPWPSFWMESVEGNEVRPIPWPSFQFGRFMEHIFLLVQVHDIGLISSTFPLDLCHVGGLVCNLPRHC